MSKFFFRFVIICVLFAIVFAGICLFKGFSFQDKGLPEGPSSTIMPYNLGSIESCLSDPICLFFTFSASAGKSELHTIYTENNKEPQVPDIRTKIRFQNVSKGGMMQEYPLVGINAKDSLECVKSPTCTWFGFYNAMRSMIKNPGNTIIKKWDKDITYAVYFEEGKESDYIDIDKAFDHYRGLIPFKITKTNETPDIAIFVTSDIKKSINGGFKNRLERLSGGDSYIFNYIKNYSGPAYDFLNFDKFENGKIVKGCIFLPLDLARREKIVDINIFKILGVDADLAQFPFSFLNSYDQEAVKPTVMDDFILFLLYQPELIAGGPVNNIGSFIEQQYQNKARIFLSKIGELNDRL